MDREEQYMDTPFGRRNPFKVPEGYFDDFASQLMDKLPEQAEKPTARVVALKTSKWHRYRPVAISAACVCAAFFGLGIYLHSGHGDKHQQVGQASAESVVPGTYSAADAMADYAMFETEDIYACMEDSQ